MKIFKVKKEQLKFKEAPQLDTDWKLPILINKDFEVIAGNSLVNVLKDEVLVIIADFERVFYDSFYDLEKVIAEENLLERIQTMKEELGAYIKSFFVVNEQSDLFDYTDYQCINESNYKYIETEFKPKHSMKGKKDDFPEDPMWALRCDEGDEEL